MIIVSEASAINAVAWSPDSNYIASGGDGRRVRVWDPTLRRSLNLYKGIMAL
jgi:WD40 repeat protein